MTKRTDRFPPCRKALVAPRRDEGFTLVELLLVMFVMSVLVALVVGVGRYVIEEGRKRETISNQDRLIAAVDAYRKVRGVFPAHDPNGNGIIEYLLKQLDANSAVVTDAQLGAEIREATRDFLGTGGEGSVFRGDAWGKDMLYFADRGLGGKPLFISAGPDGDFGFGTSKQAKEKREDNIRSDTRD